jgi:hypothetical protein
MAQPERADGGFRLAWLLGCLACLPPGYLGADDGVSQAVPTLRALKVTEPITLDGALDEPFWQQCPAGTSLIDMRTQQPATQQTTVRVAYSRTHLYIGVECLDDSIETLHASEQREDRSFPGDDWVEIHLDPAHSHRGKYAFFVNPLGTKADANEGPSGIFNYGWSAEWEAAAKILQDRWTFEMSIPLTVMNYARRNDQVWGFNVTRARRSSDTTSFWSFNPTETYKPRHFGHLTGLDLADTHFDRNWEISPYASVRTDFDGDTDTFFQSGLDVSFRLTPSVISSWTINPDYGQIEADDATIELRDTERFLPEKRLYFREGEELMRTTHRLYYSRRFTDIIFGGKASGTWKGGSFLFQDIYGQTAREEATQDGNNAILRVLQNVGDKSNLGYYLGDSEWEQGFSRVVGADGYFFLSDDWRVRFQAATAMEELNASEGNEPKDSTDFLGHAGLIYAHYPWELILNYHAITEQFNPMLGYIPRQDIFGPSFIAMFHPKSEDKWYKDLMLSYDTQYYLDERAKLNLHDHEGHANVVFQNDLGLQAGHSQDYHRPYHNRRTHAGFELFVSDYWKSFELGWAGGVFEEIDYHEIIVEKPFKPFERLPIRYEFVIRFEDHPNGDEPTVWLNRLVFDLYFSKTMWLKASFQHQDHSVHNISVIYGWEFLKNTFWYVAYNEVDDGDHPGRSLFTKIVKTF